MPIASVGLTEAGARAEFYQNVEDTPQHHTELATRVVSDKGYEKYRWIGHLPQLRRWGTGRVTHGVIDESYDVANEIYELTTEVDRVQLEDDQTGEITRRINDMARLAATHPDYLIEELLKAGTTAGFVSYDGSTFFANDHESGKSGPQDNTVSVTVSDTSNVTTTEMKKAIRDAIQRMMAFKNDAGEPSRLSTTGLVVITPPALYFAALESVNATLIENTSSVLKGAASVISMPGLTAATKFYLAKTDFTLRPFVHQVRTPIEFKSIGPGSTEEFLRNRHLYGVYARYAVAYAEWRTCVEITLS